MKSFRKVTLKVHDIADPIVIEDYVDANGKFVPIGTQAMAMLDKKETLHYKDSEGVETFIPYHAIEEVLTVIEEKEYTNPEDEFCIGGAVTPTASIQS